MSVTERQPLGLRSCAATGKLPAALLTSTPTGPSVAFDRVERRRDRTRAAARPSPRPARAPPTASTASMPRARCASSRLAIATPAPRRRELDGHRLAESRAAAGDQHDLAGERARRQHRRAERRRFGSDMEHALAPAGRGSTSALPVRRGAYAVRCHGRIPCRRLADAVLLESRRSDRDGDAQPPRSAERLELGDGDGAARSAWRRSAANRDVRVVVLRGNGRAFCAGVDLKPDVRERIVGRSPAEKVIGYYHRYRGSHRRTRFIEAIPQPIIVALHGYCLGAGFEIAMLADIRLAAEGTVVRLPRGEDRRRDRLRARPAPGAGGRPVVGEVDDAHRPPHRRGPRPPARPRAGGPPARRACSTAATALAARSPPTRRSRCRRSSAPSTCYANRGLDDALRFEALNAAVGFVSDDLVEGFAAGREKRAPKFEGK